MKLAKATDHNPSAIGITSSLKSLRRASAITIIIGRLRTRWC
jgi:hypothetical protein